MTTFQIFSDPHIHHKPKGWVVDTQPGIDGILCAGDIDWSLKRGWEYLLRQQEHSQCDIIFTLGNHDYEEKGIQKTIDWYRSKVANHQGMFLLERDTLDYKGVYLAGATWWTDMRLHGYSEAFFVAQKVKDLDDVKAIGLGTSGILEQNELAKSFISQLNVPADRPSILMTHFAMSGKSTPQRYQRDMLAAYFASNHENYFLDFNFHIHGHIHDASDYIVGDTHVICNPVGLPDEQPPTVCITV